MASQSTNLETPIGPNVARAWFDTVIRPLLIALEHERKKGGEGKWEWEPEPARLGVVRPVREYLDYQAWKNLEQLFDYYPDVRQLCDAHDQAVERLRGAFTSAQAAIVANESFKQTMADVSDGVPATVAGAPADFAGEPRNGSYVASYVLNGYERLGSHYVLAPMWNEYAGAFLKLRKAGGVSERIKEAETQGNRLLIVARELQDRLEALWRELSRLLDVPFYQGQTSAEWRT